MLNAFPSISLEHFETLLCLCPCLLASSLLLPCIPAACIDTCRPVDECQTIGWTVYRVTCMLVHVL